MARCAQHAIISLGGAVVHAGCSVVVRCRIWGAFLDANLHAPLNCSWTMIYGKFFCAAFPLPIVMLVKDTTYACIDKKDDVKIGIGSTALFFGQSLVPVLGSLVVCFVSLLVLSGLSNQQGTSYYIVGVGGAALFFIAKLRTLNVDSIPSCWGT